MHIVISLLLAASQAAPVPPAGAPDWRPLGTAQGRFAFFYDARRIQRGPGDLVTIWIRREAISLPEDPALWAISRVEIHCAARTLRVTETVTRGPDSVPRPFEPIPPGSFIEAAHRDVC